MYNDKLPPHDISAEEAVIGSLLIDGTAIYEIATFLQKDDFYHEPHQYLFEACLELYKRSESINQITVAQELDRLGKLEQCGGVAYLSHLISVVPTPLDIQEYGRIVYRLSISRHLISAGQQITSIGYQADPDPRSSIGKAEDILLRLSQTRGTRDFMHVRQVLDLYFEPHPVAEGEQAGPLPKVMSGFNAMDNITGGFQRSDLIIVAGRPGMGKTSFALNVARNSAIEQNAGVAIFSLEMSGEELVTRLISSEASVLSSQVRLGMHSEMDERKILNAIGTLSETRIFIDDSPKLRISEIRSKARRLLYEQNINLIIIDHLGLIDADTRMDNRVQEISYITRNLKALARDLQIPVIAVSQLSRAAENRQDRQPQLSDLRDSGTIEQDADVVIFIYRQDYYYPTREKWEAQYPDREYPEGIATVHIAKHRNGPTGEVSIHFTPKYYRFENIAAQEQSLI
ncbi:MAG: replicative DNA helicase [Dehalococcoidales bacterium]|nr:replicative DNA helicase [Dehalococcoidales bacterium]